MKGESVPKKSESTGTGLESYVAKLMGNGSNRTSVTEDEIQVALKDIDVSDEQLNAVYSALRNSGIQIISASGNDDAPMDVDDDDNDSDTDDFDDDEHDSGSLDDHELKMARQADAEMGSSKSKKKRTVRTSRSRSRVRGIDASTVMLTGDPVRMYLKEIGKVDLLTASEEVDLAMNDPRLALTPPRSSRLPMPASSSSRVPRCVVLRALRTWASKPSRHSSAQTCVWSSPSPNAMSAAACCSLT